MRCLNFSKFEEKASELKFIASNEVNNLLFKYNPLSILLVGSVSCGYADKTSDLDLVLVTNEIDSNDWIFFDYSSRIRCSIQQRSVLYLQRVLTEPIFTFDHLKEVNRLHKALLLHDVDSNYKRIISSNFASQLSPTFEALPFYLVEARTLLELAYEQLKIKNWKDALSLLYAAAELVSILFLSTCNQPFSYTNSKWMWFGLAVANNSSMLDKYELIYDLHINSYNSSQVDTSLWLEERLSKLINYVEDTADKQKKDDNYEEKAVEVREVKTVRRLYRDAIGLIEEGYAMATRSLVLTIISKCTNIILSIHNQSPTSIKTFSRDLSTHEKLLGLPFTKLCESLFYPFEEIDSEYAWLTFLSVQDMFNELVKCINE